MNLIFDPSVEEYFGELVEVLYRENYFSFKEKAYQYVDDIIERIIVDIESLPKKNATSYFDKYGQEMSYVAIRKNKQTQWYVFFHYENDTYYIRFIGNNHNIGQFL